MKSCIPFRKLFALGVLMTIGAQVVRGIRADAASPSPNAPPTGLASFKLNDLSFATTVAEFKRRHPDPLLSLDRCDLRAGVEVYVIVDLRGADAAVLSFSNGRLYKMEIMFYPQRVNDLGGSNVLLSRLIDIFGKSDSPDQQNLGTDATWNRPDVGRRADLAIAANSVVLTIVDTATEAAVTERRARTADRGF